MRSARRLWLILIMGCAAAHEATNDSSHGTEADAGTTADDSDAAMLVRVWRALCDRSVDCGATHGQQMLLCSALANPVSVSALTHLEGAHVDRERVRACLATIASLGECRVRQRPSPWADVSDEMIEARANCESVIVYDPTRCGAETCTPGDICLVDGDCGSHCPDALNAHQGAELEPCGTGPQPCRSPLSCVSPDSVSPGTCTGSCSPAGCRAAGYDGCLTGGNSLCFRFVAAGAACGSIVSACADGAVCDAASGSCIDRSSFAARGEPCATQRCQPGVSVCSGTLGVCVASRTALGSCTSSDECETGQYCHSDGTSGTCTSTPDGGQCTSGSVNELAMFDSCPDGYECASYRPPIGRVCVRALPLGSRCTSEQHCAAGGECARGVCIRLTQPWEPCTTALPCTAGLTCADGRCVGSRRYLGDPCGDAACVMGGCVGGICVRLGSGAECLADLDCTGACIAGVCADRMPTADGSCTRDSSCEMADGCVFTLDGPRCCPSSRSP